MFSSGLIQDAVRKFNARRRMPALSRRSFDVSVDWDAHSGRATVHFGSESFFVQSRSLEGCVRQEFDFIIYGLLSLSLTYGARFHVDAPVSQAGASTLSELAYIFEILQIPGLFDADITLRNIVPDATYSAAEGAVGLCLSGGINSTAAAVVEKERLGLTTGVLIAGADYANAQMTGYLELRERVGRLAASLDLAVVEVETDLRKFGFDWSFLHGLNLGMCLSVLSPVLDRGAIALDNTLGQDLVRNPWGNSLALSRAMSSDSFPIEGLCSDFDRVEKTRAIADYKNGVLLPDVSVCWEESSTGQNCGICTKCIQTRLNFVCAGLPEELAFPVGQELLDLVGKLPRPHKAKHLRGTVLRTSEFMKHLPDGELKQKLKPYYALLTSRLRKSNRI